MYYSPMLETVVRETTVAKHYVLAIHQKDIPGTGKPARNAERILKPKCMSTTAQMNTTLKSWYTRQGSHPLIAKPAIR
jgi:hypothetical protein